MASRAFREDAEETAVRQASSRVSDSMSIRLLK